jgi:signal transduction histidine kinase
VASRTHPYEITDCPLAGALAVRLRESKRELVLHWLDRISERVSLTPQRVFPTDDLVDHVPILVDGIADYLENPAEQVSTATPVVGKAMELGMLRHKQGFDAFEILKEYEILGGILFTFLAKEADQMSEPCEKSELLVCGHRLFQAIAIIQQTTTAHYLRLADEKVAEREDRLRAFNRAISHEIKNRIGTILGAGDVLGTVDNMSPEQILHFQEIVVRNARELKVTVENLLALARTQNDARQHRNVRLPEAVQDASRQVREAAQAAKVELRVASLPDVEVNAAVVQLCLTNYLSNAIKYADPEATDRFAEVSASFEEGPTGREIVVCVRDNGRGIDPDKRDKLFQRFFRAHEAVTGVYGTGLGLSIVRETAESVGGRAWAEAPENGSVFAFSLPFRRDEESDRRSSPVTELSVE